MKSSNIGGQAVLEGIMMKHRDDYAVAVRKPDGEIFVQKDTYQGIINWKPLTTIPFVRGIFNFIDSMVLGIKTLTFSASFYEDEEEKEEEPLTQAEKQRKKRTPGKMAHGRDSGLFRGCWRWPSLWYCLISYLPFWQAGMSFLPCAHRDRRIGPDWHFRRLMCC